MLFSRIRLLVQAVRSEAPDLASTPDFVFEAEEPEKLSRVSLAIGGLIEVSAIAFFGGWLGHRFAQLLLSGSSPQLSTVSGIAGAFLGVAGLQCVDALNRRIQLRLRLGERLAPFFGHKVEEACRVLKG
jgi:hypothetical protein